MDFLQKLFPATALPALIVGLAPLALQHHISEQTRLRFGQAAVLLIGVSAVIYVLLWAQGKIIPRRFANLVYLFDNQLNVAVIQQPFYKRVQPPGTRLGYHDAPHEAVARVVKNELGIDPTVVNPIPGPGQKWGKVEIVPRPVQVQVERRKHRLGVREHYDFVYLCTIDTARPMLKGPHHPMWMSLAELESARDHDADNGPFEDVIPTVKNLIDDLRNPQSRVRSAS